MEIAVHKFGGASLANADGICRMAEILQKYCMECPVLVVVSAMGKTTNALENLLEKALQNGNITEALAPILALHTSTTIALGLSQEVQARIEHLLDDLKILVTNLPNEDYDKLYDQIVSYGELLSSLIFVGYLQKLGLAVEWLDVRSVLRTGSTHRGAVIDFQLSAPLVTAKFEALRGKIVVTQGFIASDTLGATTTLGREGSDYSAALLGCFLGARSVTIWKDVAGLLNADPKQFAIAEQIEAIDYREVIEMSYNGAKVIHEKALKPLQNANIPLLVRSFLTPEQSPTTISNWDEVRYREARILPLIAVQEKQVLLTVSPRDLSFAIQDYASRVFELVHANHLLVRLVQNSAVRFSLSMDYDAIHFPELLTALHEHFNVSYNTDVVLFTIRHIPDSWRLRLAAFQEYLLMQATRTTSQYLVLQSVWMQKWYPTLRDWEM